MEDREQLLRLGASLKLDAIGVGVAAELRRQDVPVVVLKGSALARRLYADDSFRAHDDVDVLIAPSDAERTAAVLARLGFERTGEAGHAEPWVRLADGATIDVHVRLPGVGGDPQEAWQILSGRTETIELSGTNVQVFADDALALHTALHAAHHGRQGAKAVEDLRRAVAQLPSSTWQGAARLAEQVSATPALAAGLRLLREGSTIADSLGLPESATREVALRVDTLPVTAAGLFRLTEARGLREKARILGRELVPRAAFMRSVSPLARRGPAGLAAAYAWRPLWLIARLPRAWNAVRRARRVAR
jgi:hypothetical protein